MVKSLAYAFSQLSTTLLMVALEPRSTCSHCGSLNALDQRVPALPSTAAAAPVPAFSADDAVAGLPWEIGVSAASAERSARPVMNVATSVVAAAANNIVRSRDRPARAGGDMRHLPGFGGSTGGGVRSILPESAL
ncbi:hypothetical protein GCM10020218_077300 [Dactylosporangium vinaceum]